MKKERKLSLSCLSKENKAIVLKIEHYLETRGINDVSGEEVISDIIGMALECQERGDSFERMIGNDHEAFCKELIRSLPRQSFLEKSLKALQWFLIFAMLLMPALFLIEVVFESKSPAVIEGMIYKSELAFIIKHYSLLTVVTFGTFFIRMYTYKPMKYVIGTYLSVIMAVALFSDSVLGLLIGPLEFKVNIILWIIGTGALFAICYLTRRILAISVAYRQRKTSDKENY